MEALYAYLAGAIDIDGRIIIERVHGYRRRSDGRQVSYYKATLSLSDSAPMLPGILQATFPARRLSGNRFSTGIQDLGRAQGAVSEERDAWKGWVKLEEVE
jgi:hypothetical protein